jgi:DNA topoisomerase III
LKYLVIAEKPSVSKSIAKVIGAYRQEDGYLEGGDCVVSWCLGHLAEYAAPEHYDERYENWCFEDLPILPVEWKLLVHNTKKPQFNVLRDGVEAFIFQQDIEDFILVLHFFLIGIGFHAEK